MHQPVHPAMHTACCGPPPPRAGGSRDCGEPEVLDLTPDTQEEAQWSSPVQSFILQQGGAFAGGSRVLSVLSKMMRCLPPHPLLPNI